MPTIFTHAAVGFSGGKIFTFKPQSKKFWVFSLILPMLPDADSITFLFNIPYHHNFGHRGFFHSVFFAFIITLLVMVIFFRDEKLFSKNWFAKLFLFFGLTASHGILDAMTNGGLGIALLAPFDNTRYFFPYRPIPVSPIGISSFLSSWGAGVLLAEIVSLWIPLLIIVYVKRMLQKLLSKSTG